MEWLVYSNGGPDNDDELDRSPDPRAAAEAARDLTLRKGPVVLESPDGHEFWWSVELNRFESIDPDVAVPPEIQLLGSGASDPGPIPPTV